MIDDKISPHFRWREFACKEDNQILCNEEVIFFIQTMLEDFRDWYRRPININSSYRTWTHNKAVGGAPRSQHLKGIAVDIPFPKEETILPDWNEDKHLEDVKTVWFAICDIYNINGGVFFYNWGFHLDARTDSPRAFADFRA